MARARTTFADAPPQYASVANVMTISSALKSGDGKMVGSLWSVGARTVKTYGTLAFFAARPASAGARSSDAASADESPDAAAGPETAPSAGGGGSVDRKSTRLNSSHLVSSY